jgi:hypothetical protein
MSALGVIRRYYSGSLSVYSMAKPHSDCFRLSARPCGPTLCGVLALLSLFACAFLVLRAEAGAGSTSGRLLLRGAGLGESAPLSPSGPPRENAGGTGQFQKIAEKNGRITAQFGWRNFNNDPLRASFSIATKDLAAYKQGYGFAQSELDALHLWQKKALDDAYRSAVQLHLKQEDLNRLGAAIKAEYRARHRSLLVSRGFAVLPGNALVADIPAIARRNVKEVRTFALALDSRGGKQGYDASEMVGAALSLVQTAFLYENVPMLVNGRQTGGVYPPLETVALGKGDCDTKSALLAALLMNWSKLKLVGVGVPDHYLMAVLRNPAKGDAFVEYEGLRYVLMEPAGPAWLPLGAVGPVTTALLDSGSAIAIEPFTLN